MKRAWACLGALLLGLSCRERPGQPDAGPIPPKVAHVLVLSSTAGLPSRAAETREHWRRSAGFPNALVLANGLPEGAKEEVPALAEALASLNVAAFTLGRREASWGADALELVRTKTKAQWLAANVETTWPGAVTASTFERNRLAVAVVGLSDLLGADGFTERPLEGVLASTLEGAATRAPAVVLLVQGCSSDVATLIRAHAEWKVDVVVAAPCAGEKDERIGATMVLHPSVEQYVDVRVELGTVRSLSASVLPLPRAAE